jgi:predicted nucleic acid-binding protein
VAGLTAALSRHSCVGIDTSIFIYHIEASPLYADAAGEALNTIAHGGFRGVTSVLTLMEIAVQPLRLRRTVAADEYEMLLASFPNLQIIDIDRGIARRAAELRAAYRLKPADALQVSACLSGGATGFLTNDKGLRRIAELEVVLLDDFVMSN